LLYYLYIYDGSKGDKVLMKENLSVSNIRWSGKLSRTNM